MLAKLNAKYQITPSQAVRDKLQQRGITELGIKRGCLGTSMLHSVVSDTIIVLSTLGFRAGS